MFVFTDFVMLQVEVIVSLQICVVVFGVVCLFSVSFALECNNINANYNSFEFHSQKYLLDVY